MKIFLKILLQIIVVFLIVILAEYALYLINLKKYPGLEKSFFKPYNSFDKSFYEFHINNFRPVENKNNSKNPILIFGCSYAYGDNLKENQIFSHKLAKYTNSAIYNFGIGGAGVQHMYYMLNNIQMKNRYFSVINEPKYVFFLYVPQLHNVRLFQHIFIPLEPNEYLNYDIKSFKRISYPKIFYNSFILKSLDVYIATKKGNNFKLSEQYLVEYFSKSKKEMEKNWKNTKYYILSYDYNESCKMIIQVAEKAGWNLIFLDDFVTGDINGIEYAISKKDRHPNEHFWNEMVPNLAKRLDL